MGLKSFWHQLTTSSRVKEISPKSQSPSPYGRAQRSVTAPAVQSTRQYNAHTSVVADAVLSQPSFPPDKKAKRRSRGFSLSRNKSETDLGLKKRRSWFGGKPSDEEDVPAVPALPVFSHQRGRHMSHDEDDNRPGTALTTDAPVTWSRSESPASNASIRTARRTLTRPRSLSKKRISTFADKLARQEAPPMPTSPATVPAPSQLVDPQSGIEPADLKRKSKRKSLVKRLSLHSIRHSKSTGDLNGAKQWSWMQDQENGVPQIPPVPSLVYDGSITPDSSLPNTSSPDNTDVVRDPAYVRRLNHKSYYDDPLHTVTRGGSMKQPRPLSLPARRQSYVPKNAASGFLRSVSGRQSVSGATLTANAQARKTMLDSPNDTLGGVGQEQQLEWEKLKHLLDEMEKQQNNGVMGMLRELDDEEADDERQVFANAQALAALEFGVDER